MIPCSHVAASAARSRRDHCLLWTRLATPAAGRRRPRQLQVGDVGFGSSCLDSLTQLTSCIRLSNSEWTTCKSEARGCRGWAPPVAQRLLSARYVRARCNGPALTPVFHPPRLAPGASRPFSNPARRDRRKNLLRRAAPPRCTGCSSLVLRGPATQRRPAAAEQPCLGCTAPWPRRHRQPVTAGTCGSLAPRACRLRRRLCVECM